MSENENPEKNKKQNRPSGILRLDIGKPRRSSGGSVEFRNQPELLGENSPNSPTGVSPQLSVTWAFPQDQNEENIKNNSADTEYVQPLKNSQFLSERREVRLRLPSTSTQNRGSLTYMDPVICPLEVPDLNDSEDEDYSVSVSAIMQRRASVRGNRRKGSRRASSPMGHVIGMSFSGVGNERRRSSVYTTSSGDTAISFDDGTNQESTQEQIFENIRLHKEVLQSVKMQPWRMRRKLRLVRQAKAYVAKHEGALQERFAMSRSTRDFMARLRILLAARWQHFRRELANLSTVLIPWELRIKEIESHFGSVVASYFTFLRWLFWVNIVIAVALIVFVVVPELSVYDSNKDDNRKQMLPEEKRVASNLKTIWDFEGFLKYSPLFYGFYSSSMSGTGRFGYKLPLAYFLTGLVVYIYSFVATLRKMAENSRMSKLSSKDDECVFSWKMFTGWDFMIGHAETAHNRVASVVLGFKEALLEEAEKKKDKRNWRVIALRIIVNLKVLALLAVSAYAVILVVNRSTEPEANDSWWRSNEITVVMSAISFFFPMIFETLGLLEYYHPRQQLRLQLGRIMLLNLLNLYSLIFALFDKISGMTKELIQIRQNLTGELIAPTFDPTITTSNLYNPLDFSNVLPTDDPKYLETIVKTVATLSAAMFFNRTITQSPNITVCTNITYQCPTSSPNIDIMAWHVLNVTTTLWTTNNPFESMNETTTFGDFDFLTDNSSFIGNESTTTSYYDYDNGTTPYYEYDSTTVGDGNTTDSGDKRFNTKNEDDLDYQQYYEVYVSSIEKQDKIEEVTQGEPQDEDYELENYDDENIYKREIPVDFFDEISEMFSKLNENIEITSPLPENISEIIESTVTTLFDDFSTENSTDYNYTQSILDMVESLTLYITELTTDVPITTEFENEVEQEICYREVCELVQSTTPEDYPDYDLTSTKPTEFFEEIYSGTSDSLVPVKEITEQTTNPTTTFSSLTQATITPCRIIPENISHADAATKLKLRRLCWETMFGQELVKLTVMDLLITISSTMMFDFFRALFVRFMNKCWCWDLEKRYPKYGDFKVAENILHLVNNQGMVWMGMFFSPGLAILNLVKLVIIMYLRSWAVLSCNVPHEVVFRASRSNNFYLALLLTMLFLCVLPVGYAIVWLEPSWHCGPFSHHDRIYKIFTKTLENTLPTYLNKRLDYVASPSTVIPLLVLLILIIYYLISLTGALREANEDLKIQLKRERTEERKKMLKIAQPGADQTNAPIAISDRWKKVLASTSPLTPSGAAVPEPDEMKIQARKELIARIMKKALRKSSLATSDDDSAAALAPDDGTDTEQHDSLPHDRESHTNLEKKAKKDRRASTRPPDDKEKAKVPQFLKKGKAGDSWLSLIKTAAAEKSPKLEEDKKTEETVSHRQQRHRTKPEEVQRKDSNDEEQESNARVVSERRKSILRRQNKCPEKNDFEVVNEKPNKQSPPESKLYNEITQPEVFLFDQEFIQDRNDLNYMSDDNSSYMEILPKMKSKAPIITKSSEDLTSNKKHKKRRSPPEERKNGYDSDESGNEKDKNKRKDKIYPKKDAKIIEMFKKKDDEEIITKEPVKKIKKLNSFLALVREAVQNKKQEENKSIEDEHLEDIKLLPSTSKEFNEIIPKDKKSPTERVNKRQDSNSSNWSENIPVITISKTESDECILEEGGKAIDKHKRRRRSEKNKNVEESVQ